MNCDNNITPAPVSVSTPSSAGSVINECPKDAKIFFSIILVLLVLIFIALLYK